MNALPQSKSAIPHLGVPNLEQTLKRFLLSAEPLLSAEQYRHACMVCCFVFYISWR